MSPTQRDLLALERQRRAQDTTVFEELQERCNKLGLENQAAFRRIILGLQELPGWSEKSEHEQLALAEDGMQLLEKVNGPVTADPMAAVPWLKRVIASALQVREDRLPELTLLSPKEKNEIRQALLSELAGWEVFPEAPSRAFPAIQALTGMDLSMRWEEVERELKNELQMEDLRIGNNEHRACLAACYAHHTDYGSKAVTVNAHWKLYQVRALLAGLEREGWDIRAWTDACRTTKDWNIVNPWSEQLHKFTVERDGVREALLWVSGLNVTVPAPNAGHFIPAKAENIALFRDKKFVAKMRAMGESRHYVFPALRWLETGMRYGSEPHPAQPPCDSLKKWVSVDESEWVKRRDAYVSPFNVKSTICSALNRIRATLLDSLPVAEASTRPADGRG